ncbi:MAG: hypothetical protein ROZ64_10460 [Burkholderiaceae bacterium]|nr:hypothetical protein [Burkholderiaceae bacterium]
MSEGIDLGYRPDSYFRGNRPDQPGAVQQSDARYAEARRGSAPRDGTVADKGASLTDLMNNGYLPRLLEGEVEIARIRLQAKPADAASVYAREERDLIAYRVVDEYGGDTLQGKQETLTDKPMTLGEFTAFFLSAWPLVDVLETRVMEDEHISLSLFRAESRFYPGFEALCRQHVIERHPELRHSTRR